MRAFFLPALAFFILVPLACSAVGQHTPGQGGGTSTGESGTGAYGGEILATGGAPDGGLAPDPCDGIDNNGNGLIDEGCSCQVGASQPCWSGPPSRRGVGVCRDGVQVCQQYGEFSGWGPCQGEVLPAAEIAGNGVDEDCDGSDPGGGCAPAAEDCKNGKDDDCDGLVDCGDPDCASQCTQCAAHETDCGDGADDDCDGYVDCVDPDCASAVECAAPPPPPGCVPQFPFFLEIWCGDGVDNDCDGKIDCDDPDCHVPGQCGCPAKETSCGNGLDDDCDGKVDCADIDCQTCTPGTIRWCDDPTYCHWGKQTCGPDSKWGTCYEVSTAPNGCVGDLYSATCCVSAGECCQNYPVDQTSIGNCVGTSTCP